MRNLRWYHRLTLIGACLPPAVSATVFKCSGPHGHWHYSDHRPAGCRGRLHVVAIGREPHPPGRPPPPAPRPAARLPGLYADKSRWAHALQALLATPMPRNRQLQARRAAAIERIQTRLRYDTTRIKMLTPPSNR
ncbi:MAG: DUF4124 domain-containing protein [Gammaproteobacteria bacterium]|nr:DUF4124 domain-containing protein [Gammaproteobacteria bacterium]